MSRHSGYQQSNSDESYIRLLFFTFSFLVLSVYNRTDTLQFTWLVDGARDRQLVGLTDFFTRQSKSPQMSLTFILALYGYIYPSAAMKGGGHMAVPRYNRERIQAPSAPGRIISTGPIHRSSVDIELIKRVYSSSVKPIETLLVYIPENKQ